ncbi:helix-turn-helix transcriptional regulator [Corynebacterium macclintockiae]|uniref:Helix-turn-helix domain-containing protein n=1 Tax=Corynebacterium urealyticum TaxID=43771 RepID=A0A2W5B6L1_9CORY|nr:MAG: hypothetical protein DI609_04050 [Corynebacterium urealyticum]
MAVQPTIPAPVAARLLGMSKASVYRAIQEGTFPTPSSKVGGRYLIATRPLLDFLGMDTLPDWAHDDTDTPTPQSA